MIRTNYLIRASFLFCWASHTLIPMGAEGAVVDQSGTISADTTWSGSDIHRIVGNVTVAEGVKLTIEPGAIVKFNSIRKIDVDGALLPSVQVLVKLFSPPTATTARAGTLMGTASARESGGTGTGSTSAIQRPIRKTSPAWSSARFALGGAGTRATSISSGPM